MRAVRWLLFLILLVSLLPRAASAQGPPVEPAQADTLGRPVPMGALLRSALVPGWGQLYDREPVKAGIMVIGESWFVIETLRADDPVQTLVTRRRATTDPTERAALAADLEVARRKRGVWLRWSILFWIYQFTDAFVDAHLYAFDEIEPKLGLDAVPLPGDGMALELRLTLPLGRPRGRRH